VIITYSDGDNFRICSVSDAAANVLGCPAPPYGTLLHTWAAVIDTDQKGVATLIVLSDTHHKPHKVSVKLPHWGKVIYLNQDQNIQRTLELLRDQASNVPKIGSGLRSFLDNVLRILVLGLMIYNVLFTGNISNTPVQDIMDTGGSE
jgi:hypothetical protein